MSKNRAAAPLAGGKPLSHARGANPLLISPETCSGHHETAQPWPPGAPGDGEKTSVSAMAAQGSRQPHVSYRLPAYESPPGHGGAGDITQSMAARRRPSYVPPSQRRREQPPRPPTEPPPPAESWPAPPSPPYVPPPPRGRITAAPAGGQAPPRRTGLPNPDPEHIVRRTTLGREDLISSTSPPPPLRAHDARRPPPHPQMSSPARTAVGKRKQSAAALFFTACCILFWLLAIAVGLVFLVVYLRYRPQPPRMRVAAATLNRTTLGGGDPAAPSSYSLTLQADIYNPNTKLYVVLRYMRLDLYFHGSLVGTQVVSSPAVPLREGPGDSERGVVQLPVGVSQEQQNVAAAWQNATTGTDGGAPVVLRLVGRFHAQLNFGRWLPFRFWTYPRCTLWLDPLPGGALRGSKC